jgi:predicted phosphodiesterase
MQTSATIKRMIEAPWSPTPDQLPRRMTPEESGNSPHPFRTHPTTNHTLDIKYIQRSERRTQISRWSNLYEFTVPVLEAVGLKPPPIILQLSDVHFVRGDPRPILEVQKLTEYLKQSGIQLDMIVLTGDTITRLPDDFCPAARRAYQELTELAPHRYAVLGNHDYHGKDPAYISEVLKQVGFTDITNSEVSLSIRNHKLNIYGVDDAYFGSPTAPQRTASEGTNIVLTHNLDAIRENFPRDTDLILSGHTHWGELKLPAVSRVPLFDGMWWMNRWGYSDNVNGHTRHWDSLTDRTLSFVHPGLARYYVPRMFAHPPGFVMHNLIVRSQIEGDLSYCDKNNKNNNFLRSVA